ncbi:MAG: hypothetical protein HOC93_07955 [Phycisphaerae bacterium]|jgi:hypothetical protein|nr:hypothetical protein [Phycisphaerae bacterium]
MSATLHIENIASVSKSDREQLSACLKLLGAQCHLKLEWQGSPCPDPVTALTLLGSSIVDEVVIDEYSLNNSLSAESQTSNNQQLNEKALLFDGGVNAFHSLHHQFDKITSLVFLNGLYGDEDHQSNTRHSIKSELQRIRYQSAEIGKNLIQVDVNISDVLDSFNLTALRNPVKLYAGISHMLSGSITTLVVPEDDNLSNYNTHLSDHFDECVEFDRSNLSLKEKQGVIARNSNLLNSLRVCWEVSSRTYNCGRCKRCTRAIPARRLVESLRRREAKINASRHLVVNVSCP